MKISESSVDDTRPRVRMRPKTDARRIRFGYPWCYANEIVTDRRTKALTPRLFGHFRR